MSDRHDPRYKRDPDYGKPPAWSKLYDKHCPRDTDGCSRHAKMIAQVILRDPTSPVRRMLIDAGYEPDHWAQSIELTVKSLWEARARIWELDPIGEERRQQQAIDKIRQRLQPPSAS